MRYARADAYTITFRPAGRRPRLAVVVDLRTVPANATAP